MICLQEDKSKLVRPTYRSNPDRDLLGQNSTWKSPTNICTGMAFEIVESANLGSVSSRRLLRKYQPNSGGGGGFEGWSEVPYI